ncbi:hypothetical protein [Flavobacterium granuli]|uniref:Magnesium-transporting ATPase (P-type) n=1 Tax=Flavobacterium granuli TaxID=280093 RepID=A0ABU1S372_9FLAO|nr:hypothetical protein [Flavobacterium granuli]MDR6844609.1 magnesium-transporting ATPase (P-type) [Flavobacterium granuli]
MNQTQERLHDIEKNGYQIDFANVFNHAFENYKKIALYAGLVLFIFTFLFVILIGTSLVSVIGITAMTRELTPEKLKIENLSESNFLFVGSLSLIVSCLFSPFQAAFLKMAHCGDRDEEFHISDLFSYYKIPYLKEIIISSFLISTISFVQGTLLSYVHLELLGKVITYFISYITLLAIPLIIFGDLKAIEAIKHSILIIFKQPFVILGLIVVAFIGSLVGFIGCCIGVFFTLPFLYSMNYAIYSAIVGIDIQEIE